MKKVIAILIFLIPVLGWGQIDSNRVYVTNVSFQARDLAVMASLIDVNRRLYVEMFFQAVQKVKGTNPGPTTTVTIDSISVDVLVGVAGWLRELPMGVVSASGTSPASWFTTRINNVIKAIPNTYLQGRLAEMDTYYDKRYNGMIQQGTNDLKLLR